MRKLLVTVAALALTTGAALAADLPSRKAPPMLPPPPPPPPMWTGFYAGLNAGYNFGTNNNIQSIATETASPNGVGVVQLDPLNANNNNFVVGSGNNATINAALTGVGLVGFPSGAGLAQSGNFANTQDGFIGGGQIGYNYQWGSNFVIGIEADIQGTGIRGTSHGAGVGGSSSLTQAVICNGNAAFVTNCNNNSAIFGTPNSNVAYSNTANTIGATSVNAGVDWMGTVRGRLGYLWTPTMLVYATGGLTYGGVYANVNHVAVAGLNTGVVDATTGANLLASSSFSGVTGVTQTFIGGGSKSQTLVGWNVGGGIEWMFMPNWSLKAEGIYWNMGNMNVPTATFASAPSTGVAEPAFGLLSPYSTSPNATIGAVRVNYQGVIARMGINYHFNWGTAAPVVAKY